MTLSLVCAEPKLDWSLPWPFFREIKQSRCLHVVMADVALHLSMIAGYPAPIEVPIDLHAEPNEMREP